MDTGTRRWLKLEALGILVGSLVAYQWLGGSWLYFAMLFLVPDLSFLGYLGGSRIGAVAYNALHTYAAPALLLATGWFVAGALLYVPIWTAHIAFDRLLGYGLKLPTSFHHTHLGVIGRQQPGQAPGG